MRTAIRNRTIAAAVVAAVGVTGATQAGASTVHSAAAPSLSHVVLTPAHSARKGKGFKVSFKTKAGATYAVFYSTGQSGDLLKSGPTKDGTITTKRLGKKIHPGKITVGVRVTVGTKAKTVTKPFTITK